MKLDKKEIKKYLYIVGFTTIVLLSLLIVFSKFGADESTNLFTVESGSMEPNIPYGSIIFISNEDKYKPNEVITVKVEGGSSNVTHRVIGSVENEDGTIFYKTKGDANDAPDSELVLSQNVLGKVRLSIPLMGFLVMFAKSKLGLFTLVIIPALLIILSEVISIKDEISKLNIVKKEGREGPKVKNKAKFAMMFFVASSIILVSTTHSLYIDKVSTSQNELKAFEEAIDTPEIEEDSVESILVEEEKIIIVEDEDEKILQCVYDELLEEINSCEEEPETDIDLANL